MTRQRPRSCTDIGAALAPRAPAPLGGWSLAEVLVALLLGLLVAHLGLDALSRLDAARRRIASRTDALVALRVSRHVLRREVRSGVRGQDWDATPDSLWLRAFRGAALVCSSDTTSARMLVSYEGTRAPDPSKDSVLIVTADGRREVRALVAASPPTAPCEGWSSAAAASWLLDRPAPSTTVAARLFERGSYHLTAAALRYRRGGSGRQPLTPEVLSVATRWTPSGSRVGVEMVPRDSLAGPPWMGLLSWSGPP